MRRTKKKDDASEWTKNAKDKFWFSDFHRFSIHTNRSEIMTMCFALPLTFVACHAIFSVSLSFSLCIFLAASDMHAEYTINIRRYISNTFELDLPFKQKYIENYELREFRTTETRVYELMVTTANDDMITWAGSHHTVVFLSKMLDNYTPMHSMWQKPKKRQFNQEICFFCYFTIRLYCCCFFVEFMVGVEKPSK